MVYLVIRVRYFQLFENFHFYICCYVGIGGSCALAYPPQQLAFAYVCNQLEFGAPTLDPRSVRLIQAIEIILHQQEKSSTSR
jgi:hypothetical protein